MMVKNESYHINQSSNPHMNQINSQNYLKRYSRNIDIELQMNYDILNKNKKWVFYYPNQEHSITNYSGPYGTADAFIIMKTKLKNSNNQKYFLIDTENEVYLTPEYSISILEEEIQDCLLHIESSRRMYRTPEDENSIVISGRSFIQETRPNKYDKVRENQIKKDYWEMCYFMNNCNTYQNLQNFNNHNMYNQPNNYQNNKIHHHNMNLNYGQNYLNQTVMNNHLYVHNQDPERSNQQKNFPIQQYIISNVNYNEAEQAL
jgi:hypothetical protein